jgi:hypothetical protein
MALQQLTPIEVDYNGIEFKSLTTQYTTMAVEGGYFVNDGKTFLHVINVAAGGSINVVIDSAQVCDQGGTHDITVAIPDGEDFIIGPFPTHRFNASSTGYVSFTISEATNVTAAAFKMT